MFDAQDLAEANRQAAELRRQQRMEEAGVDDEPAAVHDEPDYSMQDVPAGAQIVIEFPSVGATYNRQEYGVYAYDEFPASSVLAGRQRRRFLASFDSLEDAKAAYPMAEGPTEPAYQPPFLDHLPDEEDR